MANMKVSLVLFAFAFVQSAQVANAAQPNIVMVFADDMGYADIGYHGDDIPTPHLVSLANQGVILENYYVSPMCTPSRACLFSGHYEIHHGKLISLANLFLFLLLLVGNLFYEQKLTVTSTEI